VPKFKVVIADRPQDLLAALVYDLSTPLSDAFKEEWVSVPSMGFRNWLSQELALQLGADTQSKQRDGITANIQMPFPGALRWLILDADRAQQDQSEAGSKQIVDPWRAERLVWTLLEVLSSQKSNLDDRLRHLTSAVSLAGRALPIALLFDRYMVHRPQMILSWISAQDLGPDGKELPAQQLWQPSLFRAAYQRITEQDTNIATPSQRLEGALEGVASGRVKLGEQGKNSLPERIFVFGQSVISADLGPLLTAVSAQHQVTALLLSPSAVTSQKLAQRVHDNPPELLHQRTSWAFLRSETQAQINPIDQESTATANELHPLLSSWALRPLESALLLGAGGVLPETFNASSGVSGSPAPDSLPPGPTLLNRLQHDLSQGSLRASSIQLNADDDSVQIHAAPGATRQAEVLRDAILALLRDNPDLTESEIVILCPQLEAFSPVLGAVFGPPANHGEQPVEGTLPALRYHVIDRSARSFNPLLDSIATMLQILPGRFDVASVSELLHTKAVRERFGLDGESLGLLLEWSQQACISWGLDGPQRQSWGIDPAHTANSWAAGVDQLMMGVALGDDLRDAIPPGSKVSARADAVSVASARKFSLATGGIAPMPLDDGQIGASGRLAEAVRTLAHVHDQVLPDSSSEKKKTVQEWSDALKHAADLMVEPARFEYWQRSQFDELLSELVEASQGVDGSNSVVLLTFADVRALLQMGLEGAKSSARLETGSILVATPGQVAAVPFKVVCILGLDADTLPGSRVGGDDLIPIAPAVGDRDRRNEARAELLSALLAAQDHLVITCASRDVRTNNKVPDSVMLLDLLEVCAATTGHRLKELQGAQAAEGDSGSAVSGSAVSDEAASSFSLVITHSRQAFDPKNFTAEEDKQPTGFDPAACQGAVAMRSAQHKIGDSTELFMSSPLPADESSTATVELTQLGYFFDAPVKAFFRNRLNVYIPGSSEVLASQLPTEIGGLDGSEVGGALLDLGLRLPRPESVLFAPETGTTNSQVQALHDSMRARGLLPPASLAMPELAKLSAEVAGLLACADRADVRRPATLAHPIDLTLPDGTHIVGSVGGCLEGGRPGPVRILYSRPKPKNQIRLALDLLVLTAVNPTEEWRGVLINRPESAKKLETELLVAGVEGSSPSERQGKAVAALSGLLSQYCDGLRYPLPLFQRTSYAYTGGLGGPKQKPNDKWGIPGNDRYIFDPECDDPHHILAFGSLSYEQLIAAQYGPYTFQSEASRLWGVLQQAIKIEHREPIEAFKDNK